MLYDQEVLGKQPPAKREAVFILDEKVLPFQEKSFDYQPL